MTYLSKYSLEFFMNIDNIKENENFRQNKMCMYIDDNDAPNPARNRYRNTFENCVKIIK